MEQSTTRWTGSQSASLTIPQAGCRWYEHFGAIDDSAIRALLQIKVPVQPLLKLQRLLSQRTTVLCVCDDTLLAQRFLYETVKGKLSRVQPLLVHEMMPEFQQNHVFDCVDMIRSFITNQGNVVITTRKYFAEINRRARWLLNHAVVLTSDGEEITLNDSEHTRTMPESSISCICLRQSSNGSWLLMDHDVAASVNGYTLPSPELSRRLLSHCVNIEGERLAPFLALMYDVPTPWKVNPELATRSLLVFKRNICPVAAGQPGLPEKMIWSDLLGIITS